MSRATPKAKRMPLQQALRRMMTNPTNRGLAKMLQRNLRQRETTPLLRMVRDNRLVEAPMLLAVTRSLQVSR